jgi:uncharacterized C2H2 Zn-finger protein
MYKCTQCDETFFSLVDCENHLETEHPGDDSATCSVVRYRCPICGLVLDHRIDCRNHALREHGKQGVVCIEFEVKMA